MLSGMCAIIKKNKKQIKIYKKDLRNESENKSD